MEVRAGYKQTEVGVIPEDWKVTTLFELAEKKKELFDDGDWIESEHITNQGVRLIQTGNIGVGHYIEKDAKKYIFESSFVSLRCKELKIGDLLICRLADPAGRACVLGQIGDEKIVTSVDVTICRPPSDKANRVFLANLFSTPKWFRLVSDRSGGTTHKRISRGALGSIPIELPPLPEQRAIATALTDVDALLTAQDKLIAKKRDIKQAAMQQLLTGKQRLPGFSGEWEVKRLGEIASLYQPVTISADQFTAAGYPVYGANGVVGFFDKFNHDTWQVTVTCRGSTCGTVNRTVDKCWITGNAMVVGCEGRTALDKNYLYFLLSSKDLSICITGSGQPQIVRTPLANFELLIPIDKAEQTAIATVLGDMDKELAALEQQRDKTRALKQGMMQELLTGRIRLV